MSDKHKLTRDDALLAVRAALRAHRLDATDDKLFRTFVGSLWDTAPASVRDKLDVVEFGSILAIGYDHGRAVEQLRREDAGDTGDAGDAGDDGNGQA